MRVDRRHSGGGGSAGAGAGGGRGAGGGGDGGSAAAASSSDRIGRGAGGLAERKSCAAVAPSITTSLPPPRGKMEESSSIEMLCELALTAGGPSAPPPRVERIWWPSRWSPGRPSDKLLRLQRVRLPLAAVVPHVPTAGPCAPRSLPIAPCCSAGCSGWASCASAPAGALKGATAALVRVRRRRAR